MTQIENTENFVEDNDLDLSFEKLNVSTVKRRKELLLFDDFDEEKKHKQQRFVGNNIDALPLFPEDDTSTEIKSPVSQLKNHCNISLISHNTSIELSDDPAFIHKICTNRKKKHKSKSIIRKAKLILPKELRGKKDHKVVDSSSDGHLNTQTLNDCEHLSTCACTAAVVPTCGIQYMNQNYINNTTNAEADSNPDELASYFEQMLYIPKPMSLMAEMMYA